ncbi:MAG: oligosaccharide flippase family protein [Chloroflexi bacterium]|nr:oligosaccharide flippase family protein [Chloroflexota bacterium]
MIDAAVSGGSGQTPTAGDGSELVGQIRGSTALLAGRLLALVVNMAAQILIVRGLTKPDFGAFAYALSILTLARILVGLGHNQAITRFLAIYEERRDYNRLFGTMVMLTATVMVCGSALFIAVWLGQDSLAPLIVDHPQAVSLILLVLLLAPIQVLDDTFEGTFAVFSQPRSIFFRKYVLTPSMRFTVVLILTLYGAGVVALAIGYVLSYAVGIGFYAFALRSVLRARGLLAHFRLSTLEMPFRSYFRFSLPLMTTEAVHLSLTTVSVVVLGYYGSVTDVAEFRAIRPAAILNQVVFTSFILLFRPLAARLNERGNRKELGRAYWQTAAWMAVFTFPVFAMTGPFAEATTVTLFGSGYRDAAPYLAILSIGYYLNAALGFNVLVLQVFERLRYVVAANLTAAATNLALSLLLIPSMGAMGAAVAGAATLVGQNLLLQVGLRGDSGVGFFRADYAKVYASIAATAFALVLVQTVLSPPFWLAVVAAGSASALVFVLNRRMLLIGETFPIVQRLPILGRYLA